MVGMPDWKIHLLFGCLLTIAWLNIFYFFIRMDLNLTTTSTLVFFILFSSVFQDVDLKKSKIRSLISMVLAFTISLAYIIRYPKSWYWSMVYFPILFFIFKLIPTKHRGLPHSFGFSIPFSSLLALLCYLFLGINEIETLIWFVVIFSSYSLHLILDRL